MVSHPRLPRHREADQSAWQVRSIYHIASSPWHVPDGSLHDQSLAFLNQGHAFTFHLGHSSPDGFWSEGARFLDRHDWQQLNMPRGGGVLVTCHPCEVTPASAIEHLNLPVDDNAITSPP